MRVAIGSEDLPCVQLLKASARGCKTDRTMMFFDVWVALTSGAWKASTVASIHSVGVGVGLTCAGFAYFSLIGDRCPINLLL